MGAVPAEDWDLVGWNAKYFGKVQLWNGGEEDGSNNSRKWMYTTFLTREKSLEKLLFVVFREKVVKSGRFFSCVTCSEPCRQRWPLLGEMDTLGADVAKPVGRAVLAPRAQWQNQQLFLNYLDRWKEFLALSSVLKTPELTKREKIRGKKRELGAASATISAMEQRFHSQTRRDPA